MNDSDDLEENPLHTYYPFAFTDYKVRLEGEGLSGDDLQDALNGLLWRLDSPEDSDFREKGIDIQLARLATMFMSVLAARAANGKELAAALFHREIKAAIRDHAELLRRGNKTLKNIVETEPQMPGLVSTHKPLMDDALGFAVRLHQGSRFPFPAGKSQGGRDSSLLTAQHDLANCLWGHISDHRRPWLTGSFRDLEVGNQKYRIHPILKEIMELPGELSESHFDAWYRVALKVLNDATNGHPQSHSLFTKGRFKAMNSGDGRKFKDRLREGLLAKARALDALAKATAKEETDSPK